MASLKGYGIDSVEDCMTIMQGLSLDERYLSWKKKNRRKTLMTAPGRIKK